MTDITMKRASTARDSVREQAQDWGWKLLTFAACDSFARRGTVIRTWWTTADTMTVAARNVFRVADASPDERAETIAEVREWLAA